MKILENICIFIGGFSFFGRYIWVGHSSHSLLHAPYTTLKCLVPLGGYKFLPDPVHYEDDVRPAPETHSSINGLL